MNNFSDIINNIGEKINRYTDTLILDGFMLTSDNLNELFNNEDVKTKVSTLSMINCDVSEIPESIINLKPKLRNLYMNYNNISTLPTNLGNMNFFLLNLTGNPITVNKHNVDILYKIYANKISERSHPTILFSNKDTRGRPGVPVIGNLDLVTGRVNKSNKPLNQHRLMITKEGSDFDKLYQQLKNGIPEKNSTIYTNTQYLNPDN
jgi:Leucine-rich repeat (LRR) protein